jgi:hypothetical protein
MTLSREDYVGTFHRSEPTDIQTIGNESRRTLKRYQQNTLVDKSKTGIESKAIAQKEQHERAKRAKQNNKKVRNTVSP